MTLHDRVDLERVVDDHRPTDERRDDQGGHEHRKIDRMEDARAARPDQGYVPRDRSDQGGQLRDAATIAAHRADAPDLDVPVTLGRRQRSGAIPGEHPHVVAGIAQGGGDATDPRIGVMGALEEDVDASVPGSPRHAVTLAIVSRMTARRSRCPRSRSAS